MPGLVLVEKTFALFTPKCKGWLLFFSLNILFKMRAIWDPKHQNPTPNSRANNLTLLKVVTSIWWRREPDEWMFAFLHVTLGCEKVWQFRHSHPYASSELRKHLWELQPNPIPVFILTGRFWFENASFWFQQRGKSNLLRFPQRLIFTAFKKPRIYTAEAELKC